MSHEDSRGREGYGDPSGWAPMQQAIADARENRKVVILNDDVSAPLSDRQRRRQGAFFSYANQASSRARASRAPVGHRGFPHHDHSHHGLFRCDGRRSRYREGPGEPSRRKIGAACASNDGRSGGATEGAGSGTPSGRAVGPRTHDRAPSRDASDAAEGPRGIGTI